MDARVTHQREQELAAEIERYLSAVEVFRHAGCTPVWRTETGLPATVGRARIEAGAAPPRMLT